MLKLIIIKFDLLILILKSIKYLWVITIYYTSVCSYVFAYILIQENSQFYSFEYYFGFQGKLPNDRGRTLLAQVVSKLNTTYPKVQFSTISPLSTARSCSHLCF